MSSKDQKKLILVWREEPNEVGYWEIFDSIEDALNFHDPVEIYQAEVKYKGFFKKATEIIRTRRPARKPNLVQQEATAPSER